MPFIDYMQDELEETFDLIDTDGDRNIAIGEFRSLMLELDERRTDGAILASFATIDVNHDGRISFEEFRAWWSR
jgi:Ca2+-binding EF-hand superfamily protein